MKQNLRTQKQAQRKGVSRILYSLLFFILINTVLKSQNVTPYNGTVTLTFNTGNVVNPNGSMSPNNVGSSDLYWTANTSMSPGAPALIIAPPLGQPTNACLSWTGNHGSSPWSKWITIPTATCGGVPGNVSCNGITDIYFSRTFNLPANQITQIYGQIWASDYVQDIWVSNQAQGTYTVWNANVIPPQYPSHRQLPIQFSWCNFAPGMANTIYVHVKKNPTITNTACSTMGMKIETWGGGTYGSITGNTLACAGSNYIYTFPTAASFGIPLSTPTNYSWTPINTSWLGTSSSGTLSTTAGTVSGILQVVLNKSTANGKYCIATGGFSITVPPPLTITPTSTMVCVGDCATLTASGANTYTWTSAINIPIGYGPTLVVCPTQNTTYKLIAKNSAGCTYVKTIFIPVSQKPIVNINSTSTVFCQGLGIGLWTSGSASSYTWLPGGSNLNNLNLFPLASVVYTLIGSTPVGCTTTKTLAVQVNPLPNLTASASPSIMCSGNSSTLVASGASSYSWTPPGGAQPATIVVSPTANTVYSVTGASAAGCRKTTTLQLLVSPSPTVTVNPPSICLGISNTLIANGAVSNNYTWTIMGSPNTVIHNTPSIVVSPTTATNFQLCGKGGNGCVKCTTFVLTPGPAIPLVANNTTLCTSSFPCTTLNVTSTLTTFSSTWSAAGSPVGASITVCPTLSTVYTISATSTGTVGCPNTQTVAVTVQTNCCSQPTAGLTQLTGLGGTFANTSYLLNSSMTLTSNTTFQNSEVWITPGVSITVPSGYTLNLDNAHLYGCSNTMWEGIRILDGGAIKTPPSSTHPANSMIEDAIVAIELNGLVTEPYIGYIPIEIEGVIFNKNRIGIRISNATPTISSMQLGINGCVFSSRNLQYTTWPATPSWASSAMTGAGLKVASNPLTGLFPPYIFPNSQQAVLKAPYGNQPGHIGIQIQNIGDPQDATSGAGAVVIGYSPVPSIPGDFNLFDGLGTGIEITEASFWSHNMVFQNMKVYNTANGVYGGNGIDHKITSLRNAALTIIQSGTYGARFWDCIRGINAENVYNMYVHSSWFRSSQNAPSWMWPNQVGQYGIYSNTNRFYHYIHDNQFNNLRYGYSFNTPNLPQQYDMTGNNLSTGIYADRLYIDKNYFGAQVTSTAAYSGGLPNTSEYMEEAIQILAANPGLGGASLWTNSPQNPGITNAGIVYNKIDRAYKGIHIESLEDCPLAVEGNSVYIEDDYTFGNPGNPAFGYGIGLFNTTDNKSVVSNTLEAISTPQNNVSLVYCELNSSNLGNASPNIHCNFTTNSHYGFHFEGSNANTVWSANHMCNEWAGLALTNNGVIGQQGNATTACDNFWDFAAPICSGWGIGGAAGFETYIENSDALLSPLYVMPFPGNSPLANSSNNSLDYNQFGAINSPGGIAPDPANIDCAQDNTGNVPSWRTMSTALSDSKNNSDYFSENMLRVYPNPTNGALNVIYSDPTGTCTLKILDLRGQLLYSDVVKGGTEYQANLSALPAAVYIVELGKEGKIIRKKLIKTN